MSQVRKRTFSDIRPQDTGKATESKVPARHLRQGQLAKRWDMSEQTLANWRWQQVGPPFLKLGNRVLYRIEDIEQFEAANLVAFDASNPSRR